MKRDMELVRRILLDIADGKVKDRFSKQNAEDQKYIYHLRIMKQAGLVVFNEDEDMTETINIDGLELTWSGNDYLDAISNDNVWNKTKEHIKQKGLGLGDLTFDVLKDLAIRQARMLIGLE